MVEDDTWSGDGVKIFCDKSWGSSLDLNNSLGQDGGMELRSSCRWSWSMVE